MKKFLDTCRRLLSIALNLFVLCAEPIALPLSWEMGQAQIFTYYTEDSNIFAAVVCAMVAVCQLWCIFTGGELPRWLKRLKFMATSCLLLTFLTVVFVLAPMNGEGGLYMLLCTSSMLYHHLLNPMAALLSYLLLEREPHLPRSDVRWALLPTLAYAAVILPLNILRVIVGPYPFFEVYHQPVYVSVLWAVGLLGVNYLYAWLLWHLGGGRPRQRTPDRQKSSCTAWYSCFFQVQELRDQALISGKPSSLEVQCGQRTALMGISVWQ